MLIAEIFHSIQGEGELTGVPSVFVRTSGCNLRCTWCDTPYTSWNPEGDDLSLDAIVARTKEFPTRFVVITGGEPMIQPEMPELTRRFRDAGFHITIETAATVFDDVACDLASLSPKLSNSTPTQRDGGRRASAHDKLRLNTTVIQKFLNAFDCQLKFVVDGPEDVAEIDELLAKLSSVQPEQVLLMPQGTTAGELADKSPAIADLCKTRGFRFCPRLQILLYGNVRGT
jgi:7-carboxy-7-deazaguanine synthase